MSQGEDAKVLTQLGLTTLQAEVYLTLTRLGKATIKTIGTTAKIDRANVYRVIAKLQDLGLVEKMITNPTAFKAVDIKDGIKMLLEHKAAEYLEIEAKLEEILQKYRKTDEEITVDECQFSLIPDSVVTFRKLNEMVKHSRKSYDLIFYWPSLMHVIDEILTIFRILIKKKVAVRLIACMSNKEEVLSENILSLEREGSFEIRYVFLSSPTTLLLIDRKEALINTAPVPMGTPSLSTNNPVLVSILQDYFERTWCNSIRKISVAAILS